MRKVKSIIEALLIVSENGLDLEELTKAVTASDSKDIESGIRMLKEEYNSSERAFNITEIAGKYRIVSRPEYLPWISNLYQKEADRLTGPSLETLAIIAYKQPVTRAEVEAIRGVNVGGVIKTLLDKGLLRVRGRKDAPGRPLLYATTEKFLEIFGLNSLEDLPMLSDFIEEDLEYDKPRPGIPVNKEETAEESEEKGTPCENVKASENGDMPETKESDDGDKTQPE
ncbi:MAG: SMC-Scp complex subunit ScpB [Candidatus Omnitrophota bacterium]